MRRGINIILMVLTIISLIIVLKFSDLPAICFPNLFVTSQESRDTYVLIYDVCLGLILSAMFYFIVDVLPESIKIRKSKKLINIYIEQILNYMNIIISISLSVYNRGDIPLKDIAIKDLKVFNNKFDFSNKEFSYVIEYFDLKSKKRITGAHSYGSLNKIVKSSIKMIQHFLKLTKEYEYFYAANEKLVEILKEIESCPIIKSYAYAEGEKNGTDCYVLFNTDQSIYKLIMLYQQLLKQKYHSKYSIVILDSEDETTKYQQKRENGEFVKFSQDCENKRNERYAIYKPFMFVGDSYSSRLIVDKFQWRFPITAYSITEEGENELPDIKDTKLIICVVSKETTKMFSEFLSSMDFSVDLIIISECDFIRRNYRLEITSDTIAVKERFSYLRSKYLFNKRVLLYKNHPTDSEIDTIVKKIDDYMLDGIEYYEL